MPPNRFSLGTKYSRSFSKTLQNSFIGVDARYVTKQTRIPANFDAIDHPRPPEEYFLLDASIGTSLQFKKQTVNVSLSVDNLLNAKYRDYLDAFRYFIDQPGRNIVLRLNIPFQFNDQKTEE
jgi:iron complex outermembrane receptor protein